MTPPTPPTTRLGTTRSGRPILIETARLARLQAQAPSLRSVLDRLDPWTRPAATPWSAHHLACLRALVRAIADVEGDHPGAAVTTPRRS